MNNFEARLNALCSVVTAETPEDRNIAIAVLKKAMNTSLARASDPEGICRDIFLELGCPDHLAGYEMAVYGIVLCLENREYIDNITYGFYPTVAEKFNSTRSRVERAIRHLIEVTWTRGDWETLNRYFGNTVSHERGKPTNGEFIARMVNIVKQQMRNAA